MDSIFLLGEGNRNAFLHHTSQSLGCTCICLWSYLPYPSNCLLFLDGIYQEHLQQPSSSSVSPSRRCFTAYSETVTNVDEGRIPGLAFKNNLPYMELKMHDILRLSSHEVQLQFYQESGIKTVVLMSSSMGEIELGFPSDTQIDLAMEIRNWFATNFTRQAAPSDQEFRLEQNVPMQNHPSGSSSSRRSLSLSLDDSTEYNISTSSFIDYNQEQLPQQQGVSVHKPLFEQDIVKSTSAHSSPVITERAVGALSQIRSAHLPSIEDEDSVMSRAILAVLSSSSPQTSQAINLSNPRSNSLGAFRNYRSSSSLPPRNLGNSNRQNMFKRAVSYLRNVGTMITRESLIQENQPPTMSEQSLHHMIQERRRRQRINESLQTLRTLIPPGFKKDKASVLSSTTAYLSLLISQLEDLRNRNRTLEMQVLHQGGKANVEDATFDSSSSSGRVRVEISQALTSTSEETVRFLDLRVNLRGEDNMIDLINRVLEFFRGQRNVSLLSIQSTPQVHSLVLRLKVEGDEFDEAGFEEAVRRVVDDF